MHQVTKVEGGIDAEDAQINCSIVGICLNIIMYLSKLIVIIIFFPSLSLVSQSNFWLCCIVTVDLIIWQMWVGCGLTNLR